MPDKPKPNTKGEGWPTAPDGSFRIPAGKEAWFKFCTVATREQLTQALEVLQTMPERKAH